MAYITKRLNAEERAYWEECLRKAVPYSQEKMDDLPFDGDSDDEEWERELAFIAQKVLAEDDALRTVEKSK